MWSGIGQAGMGGAQLYGAMSKGSTAAPKKTEEDYTWQERS